MAVFPCDWSAHRYPGPQRSMYVVSLFGEQLETTKLRFCEKHFEQQLHHVREHLSLVDEESQVGTTCDSCGHDKNYAIYVKAFDSHAEPQYYATDVCVACWGRLREQLKVASGRPLTHL